MRGQQHRERRVTASLLISDFEECLIDAPPDVMPDDSPLTSLHISAQILCQATLSRAALARTTFSPVVAERRAAPAAGWETRRDS